jgi:hypothetical protein
MLKNQLYILFLLFAILFLFSCKKRDCNRIYTKGSVYDETTHQPLGDATVYLLSQKTDCFTCQPGIITEFKTNEKGEFIIDYEGDSGFSYLMKATKEKYFESTSLATLNECSKNYKKDRSLLFITPEAYLKLLIKNTQPFDAGDYIHINIGSDLYGNFLNSFYGTDIDTIVELKVFGNTVNSIPVFIHKNGNTISKQEEIYCPAFDTTYYQITY